MAQVLPQRPPAGGVGASLRAARLMALLAGKPSEAYAFAAGRPRRCRAARPPRRAIRRRRPPFAGVVLRSGHRTANGSGGGVNSAPPPGTSATTAKGIGPFEVVSIGQGLEGLMPFGNVILGFWK